LEIAKYWPDVTVVQQACSMWVPLIENNEHNGPGADYFVEKYLDRLFSGAADIDTILLACTHYPLLQDKIAQAAGAGIRIISQGEIVAASLEDYLERHPEMEAKLGKGGSRAFYTTDSTEDFDTHGTTFYGARVESQHVRM
jgi:glutamate racemase